MSESASPPQGPSWRSDGTRRSWGGKKELPLILARLTAADAPAFETLALTLLRPAMSPPDRLLGTEAFESSGGGYLVGAGQAALPVFLQPLFFEEGSQALGEPHVRRCREVIARFADGPLAPELYLLVHNRDPRSPVFRTGLAHAIAALVASGRVARALAWDARDLIEAAFDGLFDLTAAAARRGQLSVVPVEAELATSTGLLSEVPLRVSQLSADQHRLGAGEDPGNETVADPAALVLNGQVSVRTFLLGGFGFGKTTAVARSLLLGDRHVLYVPGASITPEVTTSKVLLSRCLNTEPLFGDCLPADRQLYERMLRAIADRLFKDPSLPCALMIDGLDESPFLCRQAGVAHLLNNLERVRIPVVLAMRSEYWLSRSADLRSTAGKQASRGEPRVRQLRTLELLPWGDAEVLSFVRRFREACVDAAERQRLEDLEELVAGGRFEILYGDIPRRPLFLRLIAESAAVEGLPAQRVGRARLFHDWARWKIRRDLRVHRPPLVFPGEPTEEVLETAWEAMLQAAGSMTQVHEDELELLPECSFERIRNASPRLERLVDVLALSLQSLLILARERTGERAARVSFAHRAFQRIPARLREVTEALQSGVFDGWHFTGHGRFRERAPDLSAIWLEEDEELTPVHLSGPAKRMGVTRPLVFLNACETGQSGLSLTDAGGWAHHFLRAGAGAFLGGLWPVTDTLSRKFARIFYARFAAGLPLGEAVREARQAVRTPGDPTWLAYAVYAHPRAACRPVPGRESRSA